MKKITVFIAAILFGTNAFAADLDSTILDSVKKASAIAYETRDSVKSIISHLDKECECVKENNDIDFVGWVFIFLPVLLFIILCGISFSSLGNFKFQDALSENEIPKYTIINPAYKGKDGSGGISAMIDAISKATNTSNNINLNDVVPPTLEITTEKDELPTNNFRSSISRYIAFFSGMLTVIIAVCMTSFFIYHYMRTGCPPDLSALSTVLIALGIGVAPYAINKISTAIANKKSDD